MECNVYLSVTCTSLTSLKTVLWCSNSEHYMLVCSALGSEAARAFECECLPDEKSRDKQSVERHRDPSHGISDAYTETVQSLRTGRFVWIGRAAQGRHVCEFLGQPLQRPPACTCSDR